MRILILTQKVDINDSVLSFFHQWLVNFAKNYEAVTVICLSQGDYTLPENVKVLSLGKEDHKSKWRYIINFYKYIWQERNNYDLVLVHMNQEYVLLGWKSWWLLGKRIYLWRNHPVGSIWTRLAGHLSQKVFYTSPQSFTAQFKNGVAMPVGIDTDFFKPEESLRQKGTVLFLGRIAPIKKVIEFVEWFKTSQANGEVLSATIAGEALPRDERYREEVIERIKQLNLTDKVKLIGPVTQPEALKLYQSHEIYVNLTPSGSMDKTILEAAACGTRIIVENKALKILEGKNKDELREYVVENHSLKLLMERFKKELC